MSAYLLLYFLFVYVSLLLPGYLLIKKTKLLSKNPGIELSFGYLITIVIFATLAIAGYAFRLSPEFIQIVCWVLIISSVIEVIRARYWSDLLKLRFPIICLALMSLFSLAFINLSFNSKYTYVPDPKPEAGRNYQVLDVKVLNVAQTQANDNSIPYRQAQFFINHSDPARDCFICEWGVNFFQRTPLMGALTASYFTILNDKPPVDYIWSSSGKDPAHTFLKFQIIASILNMLFVIPTFFLVTKLFDKKTSVITCLFLVTSQFFVYNAVFSWPKSFVAFFVLLSWLLILEKKMKYTILAGAVSGIAYLTHDLAVLYIGASVLLLLYGKRFKECVVFGATTVAFAIPWLFTSSVIYHKPSNFIYYPISTGGIPQLDQKEKIIEQFLNTSPLKLIVIRIKNLVYILSPFQLLTSEGGQDGPRRLWAVGLYSVPGALGLGLMVAAFMGAFKRFRYITFWILAVSPVVLSTIVIGWPKGLAALHFAEAVVVLFSGLAVAYLVKLKSRLWLFLAYLINVLQLIFFVAYSYGYHVGAWFSNAADSLSLLFMSSVVIVCAWLIYRIGNSKKVWLVP